MRVVIELTALYPEPVLAWHVVQGDLGHEDDEANQAEQNVSLGLRGINIRVVFYLANGFVKF